MDLHKRQSGTLEKLSFALFEHCFFALIKKSEISLLKYTFVIQFFFMILFKYIIYLFN